MTSENIAALMRAVASVLPAHVAKAMESFNSRLVALEQRQPVAGRDGRDGLPGAKGDPGERGEKGEPGAPGAHGASGERGEKGERGDPGEMGAAGERGEKGEPGAVGSRGERGEKGLDGKDGKDGLDGLGFDDLEVTFDGEKTFTLTFVKGEKRKEWAFRVPTTIYRGVWKEGHSYQAGDQATWAGSQWTAKEQTSAKPGLDTPESRAWVLSVKRGNDGKTGPQGKEGPQGPRGPQGERGPERWS